jgi:IrrE N-terminal-like domain
MLEDLSSAQDIGKRTDALLRAAGAYGRYPTPVDDIVAARGLEESREFSLDEGVLTAMPKQARDLLRRAYRGLRGALDRRERVVHISEQVTHDGQKRFIKLHEVSHDNFPWQQQLVHADNDETLSRSTKVLFEQEANQGAAELLFQRAGFTNDAKSLAIGTAAVVHLANRYGSSLHAAFRRYAETHHEAVQLLRLAARPNSDGSYQRYEQPCSPKWSQRFGTPLYPRQLNPMDYPFLAVIDHALGEAPLLDRDGLRVNVQVEGLNTGYAQFVLMWLKPGRRLLRPIGVRLAG